MANTTETSRRRRMIEGDNPASSEPTLSERIRHTLEEDILGGKLKPGMHLNELELVDRFSASRTPIREAIRQLVAQGLVEVVPRKGAFVARVSLQTLLELFELMTELEATCARLAAERISAEQKAELIALHQSYKPLAENEATAQAYFETSSGFHRMLFAATQNTELEALANTTYDRLLAYRRKQLGNGNRSPKSFEEHTSVLDAVLRGDGKAAETAMRAHSREVSGNALDVLRSLRS
ncbi:MAG: GntR family transcriptional regulator [Pseudomonadota bacterium]